MQAGFVSKLALHGGRWLAGATLALSALAAEAYSVTILPDTQTVTQGAQVEVTITTGDVTADGGLGGYDFIIQYDSSILSFAGVNVGAVLGLTSGVSDFSESGAAGSFSILQFFEELDPQLLLQQQSNEFLMRNGDDIALFTLRFDTIGVGTSLLSFFDGNMSDASGGNQKTLNELAALGASVTVLERQQGVPAPGTLPLLAAAALAALCVRRRPA